MVFGQKEANNWYFGDNAGLDFNSNNPSPITNSGMRTHGGSTSRSEAQSGELQFYSNCEKVWNRNHEMMLNGDNLSGTNTADQRALVVPVPGNMTEFYLFTIKAIYENGLASNLYYSIIDMTLDNGLHLELALPLHSPLGPSMPWIDSTMTVSCISLPMAPWLPVDKVENPKWLTIFFRFALTINF